MTRLEPHQTAAYRARAGQDFAGMVAHASTPYGNVDSADPLTAALAKASRAAGDIFDAIVAAGEHANDPHAYDWASVQ